MAQLSAHELPASQAPDPEAAQQLAASLLRHLPSCRFDVPTPRPEHIEQFKTLYRELRGATLTTQQALNFLVSLLIITQYRHLPKAVTINQSQQPKP